MRLAIRIIVTVVVFAALFLANEEANRLRRLRACEEWAKGKFFIMDPCRGHRK